MHLFRVAIAVVAVSLAAPVHAQSPSELAPGAYRLYGSLDVVIPADGGATFTTVTPVVLAGWVFECRSGLQPQTQRVGEFVAYWSRRLPGSSFGEVQTATLSAVYYVAQRPDVVLVYRNTCPAVGPNVGFLVMATPPDEPADWTLNLGVTTVDGAGNRIWWEAHKEIRVWYAPPIAAGSLSRSAR